MSIDGRNDANRAPKTQDADQNPRAAEKSGSFLTEFVLQDFLEIPQYISIH